MKPLIIGDLIIKTPVIQGGMGIGISRENLASAVSNAGGLGVISGINIGYDEEGFNKDPLSTNLKSLKKHIQKAKELSNNKPLGINLMVAMNFYEEHVKTAIEAGIDIIISGAGLPIKLPKFIGNSNVKIAPIVSSAKACKLLLKMWDKKYNKTADMIVVEGPKAGGHLGFHRDDLKDIDSIDYADSSSERERVAQKVERDSIDIKKAEYMQDKIGNIYDGIVSNVTSFGVFVELENTVEGLIRFENLGDEYFIYDEEHKHLIGEHSNEIIKVGDAMTIKVIEANKESRRISFRRVQNNRKKVIL